MKFTRFYAPARLLIAASMTFALAFSLSSCEKLRARDQLNKGVGKFKGGKYADAVDHFKKAIEYDPDFQVARLYLATAYMQQWIPGAESPENKQYSANAEAQFRKVLESDKTNKLAIESLASLRFNESSGLSKLDEKLAKLKEAETEYRRLIEVDPKNKTAYYSLGVITWTEWYPEYKQAREKASMKPEEPCPLKDKKLRAELKEKFSAKIESGIKSLEKALEIDKEYDDAMAYMNLLIRERADLADSVEECKKDTETADNWVSKALATKKIKAERAAEKNKGIVQDTKGAEAK